MFTDKQRRELLDTHLTHEQHFAWVYEHLVKKEPKDLTDIQIRTLELLWEMPKAEQRNYVILDDMLLEAPTKQEYYSKTQGKWKKRQVLILSKYDKKT